ncbi:hypothetical protein ARALYDRAFT_920662 [Arabidopsis lyrata subsp. lyrata]|uniref:F-box domain-containing protein n=1 Tax=Arabidopsis lyrata subsp. lyrata TaxID=81972 RepID=D7MXJ5_ARALL|nr:hypothetical protein ARALYDRAFT_920662 [Arabidopsis lyrata subsp. lyrata]
MTTPELTKDSVEEILCRVPATNLKRLRCTCKQWNRLFKDDERFAREHCDKAAKEVLALMLTEKYRISPMSVNLNGDVPSVELKSFTLCTHEGSLRYGSQIVVWNPFTGQTRWIESGNRCKEGKIFVLGYYYQDKNKSCSKSYKVLCLSPFGNDTEIYELNSDSWRTIPDGPGYYISDSGHMVSLKGNTYWFAREIAKPHLGISLLGFDFQTEKSSSFCLPLPYQGPLYEILSLSVVREEKLSVFIQPVYTSKTEIWVTSKIDNTTTKGAVSWTKVLSLEKKRKITDLQIKDPDLQITDQEKKIVLCCERWMVMEDETKSFDKIFILGEDNKVIEVSFGVGITEGCWPAILNYVPSLARVEPAGGKRKRGD